MTRMLPIAQTPAALGPHPGSVIGARASSAANEALATVSVIVPVLNEAATIATHLDALRAHDIAEIIVVDGGSEDGTVTRARQQLDVRLVTAQRGRGHQLHAGAAAASGDILVLLHADTRLPDGAIPALRASLADPMVVGGCFRLVFDHGGPLLTASAWATRFETSLTTFGDQAMFLRRSALADIGGLPQQVLFEDVELRSALKRVGVFRKLPLAVTTSARRFRKSGAARQQVRNALLLAAYLAGVPAARLTRFYPPHR